MKKLVKTLKIVDKTHEELTKVKGALMAKLGRAVTYDEAIAELIKIAKLEKEKRRATVSAQEPKKIEF